MRAAPWMLLVTAGIACCSSPATLSDPLITLDAASLEVSAEEPDLPDAALDAAYEAELVVEAEPDSNPTPEPPLELAEVNAWMASHIPAPSELSASDPLLMVVAAGTGNRIEPADLHAAQQSADPVYGGPDTQGLPWWQAGDSDFQAGQIAIAALQAAGWSACEINSDKVQFLLWGYGDATAGLGWYYRAPQDIGTDLRRVHSLGGSNMAVDGPLNNGLPAHTAVAADADAHALADAIAAFAAEKPVAPRVVLVAHSWGAAYGAYYIDQLYSRLANPSYQLLAGVLAAAPSRALTRPLAFGTQPCPPDLQQGSSPLSLLCTLRDCLTLSAVPTHRAFCLLAGSGAVRQTPVYSFERPDDPIPPADPSLLVQAYQSATGAYPGIHGHDYFVRTNGTYELLQAWAWDLSSAADCPASSLRPTQFVVSAGKLRFAGVFGIHTERVSCQVGYGTRLVYAGSCADASRRDDATVGISQDPSCALVRPGRHSDLCILDKSIAPEDGTPSDGQEDACFLTSTSDGPGLLDNPEQANARAEAGFLGCAP